MSSKKTPPPILPILQEYVSDIVQVAETQGLTYSVVRPNGAAGVTEFHFRPMSDDALFALLEDIPDEAYAYRAIVGDPWAS